MTKTTMEFRCWDDTNKEWVRDVVVDDRGNYYQQNKCEFWGDERELVFCYETGLQDRHGEKIWGHDLIRIHDLEREWDTEPKGDWRIFEVYWNKYTWAFNNNLLYMPATTYSNKTAVPYVIERIGSKFDGHTLPTLSF